MKNHSLVIAVVMALSTTTVAVQNPHQVPDCATPCWTNSRYVSTCADEIRCLCEDDVFQSTLFQCLYTQCQTNYFGPALHYALSKCIEVDGGGMAVLPHLIRQKGLKKREDYDIDVASGYISGSVSGYGSLYGYGSTTGSVTTRRYVTMQGSAHLLPTQVLVSSNLNPDEGLFIALGSTPSAPTFFTLSPTIPATTATPEAISLGLAQ